MDLTARLAAIGPRLKALRQDRDITLQDLSDDTGISVSTLSRLESGLRRATLDLLLPVAAAYRVTLDELVGPEVEDPRVTARPRTVGSMTIIPLTRQPGNLQAYKMILAPDDALPEPRTHEGFEWFYVLSGRLRFILGDRELTMRAGEAAEFDTRIPHWLGPADDRPVELLTLFGKQGERIHLRASSRGTATPRT
ncbi:helix-turn-helix domain-containing protein [Rhodococcus zopfii]|uniref:helix-turn-helix domain-containing protein n=1 Tax=Rhodococcus zopfii TaxID=43772 RepID=UPI00093340CD|nr:XRE family transcriptional regulator [Rhodococcus zopfii]